MNNESRILNKLSYVISGLYVYSCTYFEIVFTCTAVSVGNSIGNRRLSAIRLYKHEYTAKVC